MAKIEAIEIDGVITTHMPDASGCYASACGCDGDDPQVGQSPAEVPYEGAKINCRECYALFLVARPFKLSDFDPGGTL